MKLFKVWLWICEGSGSSPVFSSFERENTELPSETSLSPYFYSSSRLSPW